MIVSASTPSRLSRLSRLTRRSVVTAIVAILAFGAGCPAWASPSTSQTAVPAGGLATLDAEAQTLASQIQGDGVLLDELDAEYSAAFIHLEHLNGEESSLRTQMIRTAGKADQAKQTLKQQIVLAYVSGGGPIVSYIPGGTAQDPSIVYGYAEIIAGGQKRAMNAYRSDLAKQATQASQLQADTRQAAITLSDLQADRDRANITLASQQTALAQVKGQLVTLVAQAEDQRRQAQQAAVMTSLGQQSQTSPVAPGHSGSRPSSPGTSPRRLASGPVSAAEPTTGRAGLAPTQPLPSQTAATQPAPAPPPTTSPPTPPPPPPAGNSPAPGYQIAIAYARAQLGKPYQWGGAGPNSFDCSGLVMMAWAQAGVYFPHLAQDQYDMTRRVAISQLLPGDLVFFGTPNNVYHVGLYIGGGDMIDAPSTGQAVSISSIFWDGLLGGGRVEG